MPYLSDSSPPKILLIEGSNETAVADFGTALLDAGAQKLQFHVDVVRSAAEVKKHLIGKPAVVILNVESGIISATELMLLLQRAGPRAGNPAVILQVPDVNNEAWQKLLSVKKIAGVVNNWNTLGGYEQTARMTIKILDDRLRQTGIGP
jgi:hypothetical protein